MSDSPPQPPQRIPSEPLRQVDWLAMAPWLILLRVPQATLGWPLLIGALGSLLLGGFEIDFREAQTFTWITLIRGTVFNWASAARFLGWIALGLVMMRLAAPALWNQRGPGFRRAVIGGLRGLPAALGAIAGLLAPLVGTLALLGAITGWALTTIGTGVSTVAMLVAFPLIAATILAVFGCPLALGAVVVDRADAFDAASRTIAYATQRLGRAAFYVAVAAGVGYAVAVPLELLIQVTQSWWGWIAREQAGDPAATELAVRVLRGFYPAYFFTAATAIYLLLRRDVDGQPIDDIRQAEA